MCVLRGDIYYANLKSYSQHVQKGWRPVLVISNNKNNIYSPVVTIIPFTSVAKKKNLGTHVMIYKKYGLKIDSMALAEQSMPIDKELLLENNYVGHINDNKLLDRILQACITQIS